MAKKTEIEIDENTEAIITERTNADGKTTQEKKFTAKVKAVEDTIESETDDFQNDIENFSFEREREIEEIPKDRLDLFFDDIRESLQNENDSFFVRLIRTPDNFDDNFTYRCNDQIGYGLFACYLRNQYQISELIQKKNNNSGGRFTLIAFDRNQEAMRVYIGQEYDTELKRVVPKTSAIVARDVFIPNPIQSEQTQGTNNDSLQMFEKMMENQNRQFDRMFQAIQSNNNQPQRTLIDSLTELKMVKELTEPKADTDSQFKILQSEILQAKIINNLIKDEPTAAIANGITENPVWWQRLLEKAVDSPEALELAKTIGGNALNGVSQMLMMRQLAKNPQIQVTPQTENPQPLTQPQQIENPQPVYEQLQPEPQENQFAQMFDEKTMLDISELTTKILTELKTTNTIDEHNQVLIDLNLEYPTIYPILKGMATNMPFKDVFQMLSELVDFNELGITDEDDELTSDGVFVKSRLKEFYEFLKK